MLKAMDRLEDRLLRLVDDEEGDPDFVRLSRAVGTLAQLQATFSKRDERNEGVGAKAKAARSQGGLASLRLSDAERRRLDADAERLARKERGVRERAAKPSNDNGNAGNFAPGGETERVEPPPGRDARAGAAGDADAAPTRAPEHLRN